MTDTTEPPLFRRDVVHAFCRHTHAEVLGAAVGKLAGRTFALKDIFDVAGHRTGFGSPDWLRTHDVASAHAVVLQQLLDAGATMVGKTHTEEMAFSITGENAHYGTPINVAAPGRVPGGSSSGSAAAVAARLADFAIGSDTGGSVRVPASYCGLFGMRPTHGRISLDGACALAPSFDTCGWFARDAELFERVGRVLLQDWSTIVPGPLLVARDAFALVTAQAHDAIDDAAHRVVGLLGGAREITVSHEGLSSWFEVFRALQFAEIWAEHGAWVRAVQPTFGTAIAQRFDAVQRIDVASLDAVRAQRVAIAERMDTLLANNAMLLLPTMPDIAPLLNTTAEETITFRERAMGLLCIAGLAGLPQVSMPLVTVQGCPIGISLIAARGNDVMLLDAARRITAVSVAD